MPGMSAGAANLFFAIALTPTHDIHFFYFNISSSISQSFFTMPSISLLAKIKKVCYNKWGILPYTKAEVIYDSDMSEK